ncbi:hypothetical protein HZA99_04645 [Candidatus Woesearchaeota archaeon]|nr:hypothetical protein [Candidatus Woesearchaeota archaeon]
MVKENNHNLLLASTLLLFLGLFLLPVFFGTTSGGLTGLTGAVSITGAAIADLKAGKMTYLSIGFLVFVLTNTLAVVGFASYFFKSIQNNHVQFQVSAAIKDIFRAIKNFFVK